MKMSIIIVLFYFWSFCDANIVPYPTLASENATEVNTTSPAPLSTVSRASFDPSTPIEQTKGCPTVSPSTTPAYYKAFNMNNLLMVAGGLLLACSILLISTLLLAWKVCQLSRRLKMLSGHSDLMIPAKYWKDNNKSDADAKETAVLMDDLNQARDEAGDGGNGPGAESKRAGKEEVHENGVEQKENGAKNEEVEETPAAATEDPSSPKEEGEKSHMNTPETTEEEREAKEGE